MDYGLIGHGIVSGVASNTINKKLSQDDEEVPLSKAIYELHVLLCEMLQVMRLQYEEYRKDLSGREDFFRYMNLTKGNLTPLMPSNDKRQRLMIFFPVTAVLNVNAPGLQQFNITITGPSWWSPYMPQNTTINLDASNSFSSLNTWVRETNMTA